MIHPHNRRRPPQEKACGGLFSGEKRLFDTNLKILDELAFGFAANSSQAVSEQHPIC